jgi:hypothetical protein
MTTKGEETQVIPGDATQGTPEAAETEPVDYKVKYEQEIQRGDKLANDLKAQQTARGKQAERDGLLQSMSDSLEASVASNQAIIKAFTTGDTEDLPEELNRIQEKPKQDQAQRESDKISTSLFESFKEAAFGADGTPVGDVLKDPEYAEARTIFTKALEAGDVAESQRGIAAVGVIRRQVERERTQKAAAETKKKLELAGVNDLDIGAGAGGGASKSWAEAQKIKNVKDISDAEYEKLVR